MRRDTLLLVLIVVGSALWRLPQCMEPSLDLHWWLPLVCIALCTAMATILSGGRWLRFVSASTLGTLAGLSIGGAIGPSPDPLVN